MANVVIDQASHGQPVAVVPRCVLDEVEGSLVLGVTILHVAHDHEVVEAPRRRQTLVLTGERLVRVKYFARLESSLTLATDNLYALLALDAARNHLAAGLRAEAIKRVA